MKNPPPAGPGLPYLLLVRRAQRLGMSIGEALHLPADLFEIASEIVQHGQDTAAALALHRQKVANG